MKKALLLIFCCMSTLLGTANDGVFYAAGNQLIPITETDIRVQKEVLTLNRVGDHIEVTVYYEFFNPVGEKELLVGFEARSPYNSNRDPIALFPNHPHMRNFKVVMNGQPLHYEIAHVTRGTYDENDKYTLPAYYSNGQFKDWSKKQCEDSLKSWEFMASPFDYVYHFKAKFRTGVNTVQHTYEYDLSFSVAEEYNFPYVLTAANRWANNQIDDFTLNINMGDRESFRVMQTFFDKPNDWTINGLGMAKKFNWSNWDTVKSGVLFHIQKGGVSFHKKNFHPDGELHISKDNQSVFMWSDWNDEQSTCNEEKLIKGVKTQYFSLDTAFISGYFEESPRFTSEQRRILKNLPFAYRGYKFKDKTLRKFFESTDWYIKNPNHKGKMEGFSEEERKWVEFWSN